jgi:catechol 2,3-dioxygenase-like lactoylglutathione lyase family enzyme
MSLDAVLDHVAIAVPDPEKATVRWCDLLGAGRVGGHSPPGFTFLQVGFPGGARLELLAPPPDGEPSFVDSFLERFGAQVHHVTLKVPDLLAAVDELREAGLDVVDVNTSNPHWQEAFLRPTQVGGLVVQVSYSPHAFEDGIRAQGGVPEEPRPDAATLLGPALRHPDLDRARWLWSLLGATVTEADGVLRCTWPDSPVDVMVEPGEPAGPIGLRMAGTEPLDPEDGIGPRVLVREPS